jgi:hypothetical protein
MSDEFIRVEGGREVHEASYGSLGTSAENTQVYFTWPSTDAYRWDNLTVTFDRKKVIPLRTDMKSNETQLLTCVSFRYSHLIS